MAKVTREHFEQAQKMGWDLKKISELCGVSKQAVTQMRKKYFPHGLPPVLKEVKPDVSEE